MTNEVTFGIKIKADGSGFVGEVKLARDALGKLGDEGEKSGRRISAGMDDSAKGSDRLAQALGRIAHYTAGGLGLSVVAGRLIHTADAMTNLESRLKLVTSGFNDLAAAQSSVFNIAQSTRSSLEATGDIYYKMSKGAEALGLSQAKVSQLTETIAQAMTLSGSSAESAKATLMQFGQALSSGVLRGEELNSVMEQAPALAEAIAKGMGKSVGELRRLGEAGELTVQQIMAALEKSAPEVARQFATLTPTIGGAYQQLSNSAAQFIGQLDKQTHASSALAFVLQSVSANFEAFAAAAATTASVGLGGLIGKQVQAAAATRALSGQTLAQIMADGTIDAAIANLKKTQAVYAAVMSDPRIVEILDGLKASLGGAVTASYYAPQSSYQAPQQAASSAIDAAADNAANLAAQMADVAYQMKTLGLGSLAKSLLDIAKSTTDAIAAASKLGAAESDLQKIRDLGAAQTKKLLDDAAIIAYRSLDSAQGGKLQALYDPANAQADHNTAMSGLASSLGVSGDVLETLIAKSGGLLQAGIQYWDKLSAAQKQATIEAVESQATLVSITKQSWDAQLAKVSEIQGWIDQVKTFDKSVDDAIFGIQLSQANDGGAAMLKSKEASLWGQFNSYGANIDPASLTAADVQHQIDLAGELKDTILQRYQIETAAVQKLTSFAQTLSDYSKSLKIGDLSPLTIPQKVAEAKAQYDAIVKTLRDPNASVAEKEKAQGKFTGAADAYLKLGQQYTASGAGYTAMYNQVQADTLALGADALTDAQRQTALLTTLSGKASDTITSLGLLKTSAAAGLDTLGKLLKPELDKLGGIANSLGANGAIAQALTGLPASLSALLVPYLDAANRPAALAATAAGKAPWAGGTGAAKGSNFTASYVKDSVMANYRPDLYGEKGALKAVYDWAVAMGVKSEQIDAAFGNPAGSAAALAKQNGWPAFASGTNYVPYDMPANIHQGERIFPAADNRELMARLAIPAPHDGALLAALGAVQKELAAMRLENARLLAMLAEVTARSNQDAAETIAEAVESAANARQMRMQPGLV